MEGVYYTALVKDEGKINEMIKYFDKEPYKPVKVELSLDQPENGSPLSDGQDFELKLKQGLQEWSKLCQQVYDGRSPNCFKGILLEPDGTGKKLPFVFARFAKDEWRCHGYFPCHSREEGMDTAYKVVGLLRQLEDFVDQLDAEYSFAV